MGDKILGLKDFSHTLNKDIICKSKDFQKLMNQLDNFQHNGYFIESITNTGSHMKVKLPYNGGEKEVTSFVSNDYLGLSRHPEVVKAAIDAINTYGAGACAAPIIGGYMQLHRELEEKLADFVGQEDAIIFSSGFGANEGAIKAILGKNDIALIDTFIHSSTINGLSDTNIKIIGHNDINYLERTLIDVKNKYNTKLVIVDGVYSQDGDIALLPEILSLCKKHDALLMVDDAHGIGTFGETGRGVAEHYNLLGQIDIITGTLSKSFGCVGGFVAASKEIIRYIRYYAPHSVFSAAPAPSVTASAIKAIEIIKKEPQLREKLWSNIALMNSEMNKIGVDIKPTVSPIFPIKIRDNQKVRDFAAELLNMGFYATAVSYPAVREKDARIRTSILSTHTEDDILKFASAINKTLNNKN